MRMRLLFCAALVLAGCTMRSSIYPYRVDVRADHDAFEQLGRADTTSPEALEEREGWIDGIDVNALRITPTKPGLPDVEVALPDVAVITEKGRRISRAELQPGDEVRVSFSNRAGPMPRATAVELVARAPN